MNQNKLKLKKNIDAEEFNGGLKSANNKKYGHFCPPSPSEYDLSATMVDPIFDYQFRIILIGDSTVGKSSLLRSFTDGTFAEVSDPTVGVDFFARVLRVNDQTPVKLQLWDTAGQERFRSITKSYYRNSVGVVLSYDICNRESFKNVENWMRDAKKHIEPHKAVFILVGCKKDIADADPTSREVSVEEAESFAAARDMKHFETSSKTRAKVEQAFTSLSQTIYDKILTKEYKLDDGWDGIKKGFLRHDRSNFNNNSILPRGGQNRVLLEAESADRKYCC